MICPICEKDSATAINPKHSKKRMKIVNQGSFSIFFCQECETYFAQPLPTGEFLVQHYARKNKSFNLIKNDTEFREKNVYPEYFNFLSQFSNLKPKGKVLEIGCYSGSFLKRFVNLGYDCLGLDLHDGYLNYCKTVYALNVKKGTIFDFKFKDGEFDIIIFHQLLEHLGNPNKFLEEVYRILGKEGVISLSVPSVDANEFTIDIPNHLFYYSRKSLNLLLHKHYFENVVVAYNQSKKGLLAYGEKIIS